MLAAETERCQERFSTADAGPRLPERGRRSRRPPRSFTRDLARSLGDRTGGEVEAEKPLFQILDVGEADQALALIHRDQAIVVAD